MQKNFLRIRLKESKVTSIKKQIPNMTKKHFIKFAAHIKQRVAEANGDRELLARAKAIALAVVEVQDNPNFDKVRFFAACGL